jgi:hypothetical protein
MELSFAVFVLLVLPVPNEPVIGSPNGRCFRRVTSKTFKRVGNMLLVILMHGLARGVERLDAGCFE